MHNRNVPVKRVVYYTNRMLGRPLPPIPTEDTGDSSSPPGVAAQTVSQAKPDLGAFETRVEGNTPDVNNDLKERVPTLYEEWVDYEGRLDWRHSGIPSDAERARQKSVETGHRKTENARRAKEGPTVLYDSGDGVIGETSGKKVEGYSTFVTNEYAEAYGQTDIAGHRRRNNTDQNGIDTISGNLPVTYKTNVPNNYDFYYN